MDLLDGMQIGDSVRLKKSQECGDHTRITVTEGTHLQLISRGMYKGEREYCLVNGRGSARGLAISIECSELRKALPEERTPRGGRLERLISKRQ